MEPKFYRIRNWNKYQHYSKRNPPWSAYLRIAGWSCSVALS
jgi:hypothetical protein